MQMVEYMMLVAHASMFITMCVPHLCTTTPTFSNIHSSVLSLKLQHQCCTTPACPSPTQCLLPCASLFFFNASSSICSIRFPSGMLQEGLIADLVWSDLDQATPLW